MSAGGPARQLKRSESSQSATSCTNFTTAEILQTFVVAGHRRWHSILLMFQERIVGGKTFAELQWKSSEEKRCENQRARAYLFWMRNLPQGSWNKWWLSSSEGKNLECITAQCIYNASHLLGTTLHFRYLQIFGSWILCFGSLWLGQGPGGPRQVQWTPWELCCGHGHLGVFQDL